MRRGFYVRDARRRRSDVFHAVLPVGVVRVGGSKQAAGAWGRDGRYRGPPVRQGTPLASAPL